MLIDARTVPPNHTVESDLCIVGAGAAGITLARELSGSASSVVLLESGAFEPDERTQQLCNGEIIGHPYHPLVTTRLRYFGGSTNHWTGACRALDAIDFEKRDWVPNSGWPFDRVHLEPYYRKAQPLCELGPFAYDGASWEDETSKQLSFETGRIESTVFQFSPPTRFGNVYRETIVNASNIDTYLNANVTEFETRENGHTVTHANVACFEGNEFKVTARHFVLAAGGIENPRLLLLSNQAHNSGIGNDKDLVGRFFLEHPHIYTGELMPTNDSVLSEFYQTRAVAGTRLRGALTLSAATLRKERILNFAAFLRPAHIPGDESLQYLSDMLRRRQAPRNFLYHLRRFLMDIGDISEARCRRVLGTTRTVFSLHNRSEQSPNPASRVVLADERDALGKRMAALDWQLSDIDKYSLRRAHEILAIELGRAGLGRLRLQLDDGPEWPATLSGGNHHMGTTRMHDDPNHGVVDQSCKVHGVSNLYVAGSSVFPTAGFSNPTLTIVALAIRLAEHLQGEMQKG